MRYLSRTAGSSTGFLSWKVDLRNSDFEVEFIDVLVNSATFENGSVHWKVVSGTFTTDLQPGRMNNFHNQQVGGSKELTLKAFLTGGRGAYAWQHAQLFRTKMNSSDIQFNLLDINLQDINLQAISLQAINHKDISLQDINLLHLLTNLQAINLKLINLLLVNLLSRQNTVYIATALDVK